MRKILFIQYALLIFYCSSEDENYLAESISVNGTNIYAVDTILTVILMVHNIHLLDQRQTYCPW